MGMKNTSFVRNLPNAVTCCNLMSGCVAVFYAFVGCYATAFLFIVIGAVFDFLDGFCARLLGVSSPVGKELDSLSDVVTFGVAPSAMAFSVLASCRYPEGCLWLRDYAPYVSFVMAAFSALRLAKFNLDSRQTTSFIGLPTPANALFWASLVTGWGKCLLAWEPAPVIVVALLAVSCALLVAELPMFALKFKSFGWRGNEARYVFLIVCLPLLAVFRHAGFAAVVVWYVLLSLWLARRRPC